MNRAEVNEDAEPAVGGHASQVIQQQVERPRKDLEVVPVRVGVTRALPGERNAHDGQRGRMQLQLVARFLQLVERKEGLVRQRLPWLEHTTEGALGQEPVGIEQCNGAGFKERPELRAARLEPVIRGERAHEDLSHWRQMRRLHEQLVFLPALQRVRDGVGAGRQGAR
eukprot:scaffold106749_cov25-Tisochrysis_lutea.AAC.3